MPLSNDLDFLRTLPGPPCASDVLALTAKLAGRGAGDGAGEAAADREALATDA